MVLGVIPARYASTRLPGKPLADIAGQTLIERVYRRAMQADRIDKLVVATDDLRIAEVVRDFGGEGIMTSSDHPNGTSRTAEVARQFSAARFVINIQGDEPFLEPTEIDLLVSTLERTTAPIATLMRPLKEKDEATNPNVVKVVVSATGKALYFSRAAIPFHPKATSTVAYWAHVGLYGFRAAVLPQLVELPVSSLERAETLEQLRWLEHDFAIQLVETPTVGGLSVDTPEDLKRARKRAQRSAEAG